MALPIEDYALIGDRRTAALVGTNGSVDWLCLPNFDSAACLAGLLGTDDHGHWQLVPDGHYSTERRYVGASAVLETTFTTSDGVVTLTDLMPRHDDRADLVRKLRGVHGTVRMRHEWRVRLDYGLVRPWVRRTTIDGEPVITAVGGPDLLVLRGPRLPKAGDGTHNDEFDVAEGDELVFSMTWFPSYAEPTDLGVSQDRIEETIREDEEWAARCTTDLPHSDVVRRSLLTLRLMTDEVTGGIVAAPTTSLPEDFGGERNWDYRYCWLRDAALTLDSLVQAGYTEEADLWRDWLLRTIAGDPAQMQIMYAVDGSRRLPEVTLDHLPGYADSRPVRIGNGAVDQTQNDVLGEVMHALDRVRRAEGMPHQDAWPLQRTLVAEMATRWQDPDHGLWEIRGEPQHFTHSRVMIWVAFDRAVRAMEDYDLAGPLEEWRALRDQVREEVLEKGYDAKRGTFVQHYGTTEVDASLLTLSLVGFLDGDDPRMLGHHPRHRGGPPLRGTDPALPDRERRRRAPRRRAPVRRLLVLAGLGVRRGRPHRGRARPLRPAGRPAQRRRPALGGVRPGSEADGGQLPAGVQPPRPGPGGVLPGGSRRASRRRLRWLSPSPTSTRAPSSDRGSTGG